MTVFKTTGKLVTRGVYNYTLPDGLPWKSFTTCGQLPKAVFDLSHPAHNISSCGNIRAYKTDSSGYDLYSLDYFLKLLKDKGVQLIMQ